MKVTLPAAVLGVGLLVAPAAAQQAAQPTDYFKTAGNFLANCDARADAGGERPPENYLCLSYVSGLIEGYTVAAIANGNLRPYCLPRPVTLVEMMDLMAVAIERGAPPQTPTAQVFHNILAVSFPCDRPPGLPSVAPTDDRSEVGIERPDPASIEEPGRPAAPGASVDGASEEAADDPTRPLVPPTVANPGTEPPVGLGVPVDGQQGVQALE
ncbi:Rap1a/Tai family immunity protein [Acuticoccus sp.]|uniref:Rap1a/Tai family immunity protein n=1 Tax=Acuticoccus sp. TaxID=1904378 RepID=UPI003B51D065